MTTKTDCRSLFDSKYLGSWDVAGKKDAVLVIDRCEGQTIKGTTGEEKKAPVLYFRNVSDTKKGMVLNKTNTKTLIKLHGAFIEDWPGKRIAIYAGRTNAFGEEVDCLRIRPTVPPTPLKPGELPLEREAGDEATA
jgi:hypothetical protein